MLAGALACAIALCGAAPSPHHDLLVTVTDDGGPGSLRAAILEAIALEGEATIRFDAANGPFGTPQIIRLGSPLPPLPAGLTIDGRIEDRLWRPVGVTISGGGEHRVFEIPDGAVVTLRALTITDGAARDGGAVRNAGTLIANGTTFLRNHARRSGGAIVNAGGTTILINSTFADNRAGASGGGLAVRSGDATVTNCTFSGNRARRGGGLFSRGTLLLRNTILADNDGRDCDHAGVLLRATTHNIIRTNDGCGAPISEADPLLTGPDLHHGPTPTFALRSGSPAINHGDNASAVDERGEPLRWDQRGNGDPRIVAGFVDIGALEHQYVPDLTVDVLEDVTLRGCTRAGRSDCSLRGAIEVANALRAPGVIRFDRGLFAGPRTLHLQGPLPAITVEMTLDGGGTGGVTLSPAGSFRPITPAPGIRVDLRGIDVAGAGVSHPGGGANGGKI